MCCCVDDRGGRAAGVVVVVILGGFRGRFRGDWLGVLEHGGGGITSGGWRRWGVVGRRRSAGASALIFRRRALLLCGSFNFRFLSFSKFGAGAGLFFAGSGARRLRGLGLHSAAGFDGGGRLKVFTPAHRRHF